jgi:hypothetical protein
MSGRTMSINSDQPYVLHVRDDHDPDDVKIVEEPWYTVAGRRVQRLVNSAGRVFAAPSRPSSPVSNPFEALYDLDQEAYTNASETQPPIAEESQEEVTVGSLVFPPTWKTGLRKPARYRPAALQHVQRRAALPGPPGAAAREALEAVSPVYVPSSPCERKASTTPDYAPLSPNFQPDLRTSADYLGTDSPSPEPSTASVPAFSVHSGDATPPSSRPTPPSSRSSSRPSSRSGYSAPPDSPPSAASNHEGIPRHNEPYAHVPPVHYGDPNRADEGAPPDDWPAGPLVADAPYGPALQPPPPPVPPLAPPPPPADAELDAVDNRRRRRPSVDSIDDPIHRYAEVDHDVAYNAYQIRAADDHGAKKYVGAKRARIRADGVMRFENSRVRDDIIHRHAGNVVALKTLNSYDLLCHVNCPSDNSLRVVDNAVAANRGIPVCDEGCTTCLRTHGRFDYSVSVHSLQFFRPDELAGCMLETVQPIHYAYVRVYDQVAGSFCGGDLRYALTGDGCAHVSQKDSVNQYLGTDLLWLRSNHLPTDHGTLAWQQIDNFGDTRLIAFTLTPVAFAQRFISPLLDHVIRDDTYYGPVGVTGPSNADRATERSKLIMEYLPGLQIKSLGPTIWVSSDLDNRQFVLLPKSVIWHGALLVAQKDRTPDQFMTLSNNMRHHIAKSQIPPEHMARAVTYSTALSFIINVDFEAAVTNRYLQPKTGLFALHSRIMRFDFIHNAYPYTAYVIMALVAILLIISFVLRAVFAQLSTAHVTTGSASLVSIVLASAYAAYGPDRSAVVTQAGRVYEVIASGLRTALRDDRPIGNVSVRGAQSEVAQIEYSNDLHISMPLVSSRNDPEKSNPLSAVACGIIVTDTPVHVQQQSLHNQRLALTNRVGAPVPAPDRDEQRAFLHFVDRYFDDLFSADPYVRAISDDSDDRYRAWVSRFTPGQQRVLDQARAARLSDGLPEDRILYAHDLFNKVEKAGKDAKPRPIQAASPALNEAMGPETFALSAHMRRVWDSHNFLTYAPGCTAFQLGDKFNRHSHLRPVEADNKMHDTTMRDFQHKLVAHVLKRLGCSKSFVAHYWKNRRTYGHSKLGIGYKAGTRVKSGDQTTTFANTIYVILNRVYVYCRDNNLSVPAVIEADNFSVMGAGDDSFQFQPWEAVVPDGDRERRLGTMPEFAQLDSADMASFCSNLFYPVTRDGVETYVLAPMAGRVIPRLGWFVNCPGGQPAQFARGAALGLQRDVHFIPYLNQYIKAILRVTAGVTPRASARDRRNWDNIFHTGPGIKTDGRMRDWWQRRYGQDFTQSVQAFERQLEKITSLPYAITPEHIRHIIERDYPDSIL